jgi:xylan 1,4-beta-xylosidase
MVYHIHDKPHSTGGMFRQVCVDQLVLENDTTIAKMKSTHAGVDLQLENAPKVKDIAQGTNVSASSYYELVARPNRYNHNGINHAFNPQFEPPSIVNREEITSKSKKGNGELLVEFDAELIKPKSTLKIRNTGILKGHWIATGNPTIERVDGVKALRFDGKSYLTLDQRTPSTLAWNSPFTASVWVYNTEVGLGECLLVWNTRQNMLQSSYAAMMFGTGNFGAMAHGDGATDMPYTPVPDVGKWHHIVVTFDGLLENVYVNGELNNQLPLTLFVEPDKIMIGASGEPTDNLTGYIAKVQMYNRALNETEVKSLMKSTKPLENRK